MGVATAQRRCVPSGLLRAEVLESCGDDIGILNGEVAMVEEHVKARAPMPEDETTVPAPRWARHTASPCPPRSPLGLRCTGR